MAMTDGRVEGGRRGRQRPAPAVVPTELLTDWADAAETVSSRVVRTLMIPTPGATLARAKAISMPRADSLRPARARGLQAKLRGSSNRRC